jgi:hypothetical protein
MLGGIPGDEVVRNAVRPVPSSGLHHHVKQPLVLEDLVDAFGRKEGYA